jgi:lysyl-tRNA synthetase class I
MDKKEGIMTMTFEQAKIISQLLHKEQKSILRRYNNRKDTTEDKARLSEIQNLITKVIQVAHESKTHDQRLTWGG